MHGHTMILSTGVNVSHQTARFQTTAKRMNMQTHFYDQQVKDDIYKASDATCTEVKKYYYSCMCGAKGTEVFTGGDPLGHTWEFLAA